jgi:hypothetical protein
MRGKMILPDLLQLAERDDLTPPERAALRFAITMLGGPAGPIHRDEFRLLPNKIELLNGELYLTRK